MSVLRQASQFGSWHFDHTKMWAYTMVVASSKWERDGANDCSALMGACHSLQPSLSRCPVGGPCPSE